MDLKRCGQIRSSPKLRWCSGIRREGLGRVMKSPAKIVDLRTEVLKLGFHSKKCGFYPFDRIVSDGTEILCWVICSSINTGHMFAIRSAVCLFWLYYLTTHHNESQGTEFVLYDAAQAWSNHWTNPGLLAVTRKLAASQSEKDTHWNHKITVKKLWWVRSDKIY